MPAPRQETLIRPTDVVADVAQDRLGNSGLGLFDDLISRLNQAFGLPLEVNPASTPNSTLIVGAAQYLLPDGQRQTIYSDGAVASLVSGVIDFTTGLISGGSVSGFALPSLSAGQYVKALVEYEVDSDSLNVTFGVPNASLSAASTPAADTGYVAVALAELHSTIGGTGVFDPITRSQLIKLLDFSGGSGEVAGPREESQTVVGSPASVFNLVSLQIPANRLKAKVEVNGVAQENGVEYTVTSDTQITFAVSQPEFAKIKVRVG